MIVTCKPHPVAYVSADLPEGERTNQALNLIPEVEVVPMEMPPGHDEAPIIVDGGTHRTEVSFEIEERPWEWDLNVETREDGSEWAIERHRAVRCPQCGTIADHLSVPIGPYPFLYQGLDRRERAIRSSPEVLDILADIADLERRERLLNLLFLHPVSGGATAPYSHVTEGAVALVAATAKTVLGEKAGSAVGLMKRGYEVGFDGVTASAVPVLVELVYATWATNSPGTNSTGTTERQEGGRVIAADWTGGRNWTTEPTTVTVLREKLLSPNGGLVVYDFPLGTEQDCAASEGFGIRCTAPAVVNVRATSLLGHL